MKHSATSGTEVFLATILGGAIGATIALFCAPKSGKQLRRDLSKKCEEIREGFSEIGEETAEWIKDKTAAGKEAVEEASTEAKHLAKKGKNAVKETAEELKK